MSTPKVIDSFTKEYYWLSNFGASPVTVDILGNTYSYSTGEHLFHAYKVFAGVIPTGEENYYRRYLTAMETMDTPGKSKSLGRKISLDPKIWDRIAFHYMLLTQEAKYTQNPHLAEKLLGTGNATLIEGNTHGDKLWGTVNGVGLNLLGRALEITRAKLVDGSLTVAS